MTKGQSGYSYSYSSKEERRKRKPELGLKSLDSLLLNKKPRSLSMAPEIKPYSSIQGAKDREGARRQARRSAQPEPTVVAKEAPQKRAANSSQRSAEEWLNATFRKYPGIAMAVRPKVEKAVEKGYDHPDLSPFESLIISRVMQQRVNENQNLNPEERNVINRQLKLNFEAMGGRSIINEFRQLSEQDRKDAVRMIDMRLNLPPASRKAVLEVLRKEIGIY